MLAKSVQAKFLVPMAVSLAFGVLFATFITLVIVPSIYVILEDVKGLGSRILGRGSAGASVPVSTGAGSVGGQK